MILIDLASNSSRETSMANSNDLPVLADGPVAAGANPTAMGCDDEPMRWAIR